MEPQIEFAKTEDGVTIAYWTFGEGKSLILMPSNPLSATHDSWRTPQVRRWYEGIARSWRLVRYDPRGAGLSQRDAGERSLETRVLDLHAVVNELELPQVSLFANASAGPPAISYAAMHEQLVSSTRVRNQACPPYNLVLVSA